MSFSPVSVDLSPCPRIMTPMGLMILQLDWCTFAYCNEPSFLDITLRQRRYMLECLELRSYELLKMNILHNRTELFWDQMVKAIYCGDSDLELYQTLFLDPYNIQYERLKG